MDVLTTVEQGKQKIYGKNKLYFTSKIRKKKSGNQRYPKF